jgi:phenylalanyl-tRNA synthetase alpha chain
MAASGPDLSQELLALLGSGVSLPISSLEVAKKFGVDHQRVVGAVKSLQSLDGFIRADQTSSKSWTLTAEGEQVQ